MREVTENDFRMPEFRNEKVEDYEFREDGKVVRKDRWQRGFRNIASLVVGARAKYEIDDVVRAVGDLVGDWCRACPDEDPETAVIDIRLDDGSVLKGCERVGPSIYTWREGTIDIKPEDFGAMAVQWKEHREAA